MKRDELPTPVPGHQKASAAVTAALGTLPYPITKEDAIARVGGWTIPYAHGAEVPLADILRGVPDAGFEDAGGAAVAVDRHWGRIARSLDAVAAAERGTRAKAPRRRM